MNAHAKAQSDAMKAVAISATVNLAEFRAAVAIASELIENRNTYPALGCILLTAGEVVVVSYRGIDNSFRLPVTGAGHGSVLIPKRALAAFLRGATGETATISKKPDEADVTFADAAGFVLKAVPEGQQSIIDDYASKVPADTPALALADGVLAHLFALTMPFISNEATRYYLNGVCLQFEDGGHTIRAIATDGHRLGSRAASLATKFLGKEVSYIVPNDAVTFLAKHMAPLEIRARLTDRIATFTAGTMTFTTKLIEGTFPDWRRVVLDFSEAGVVEVDTKAARRFMGAARAIRHRGRFGQRALRIFVEAGRVMFESKDVDVGTITAPIEGTAPETIGGLSLVSSGSVRGPELPTDFGVNAAYLDGIFKMLGAKATRLLVRSPGDPIRVEVEGRESDIVIIMPMRV